MNIRAKIALVMCAATLAGCERDQNNRANLEVHSPLVKQARLKDDSDSASDALAAARASFDATQRYLIAKRDLEQAELELKGATSAGMAELSSIKYQEKKSAYQAAEDANKSALSKLYAIPGYDYYADALREFRVYGVYLVYYVVQWSNLELSQELSRIAYDLTFDEIMLGGYQRYSIDRREFGTTNSNQ